MRCDCDMSLHLPICKNFPFNWILPLLIVHGPFEPVASLLSFRFVRGITAAYWRMTPACVTNIGQLCSQVSQGWCAIFTHEVLYMKSQRQSLKIEFPGFWNLMEVGGRKRS
jgi:hypothetical protein